MLSRNINGKLQEDWCRRADKSVSAVDSFLASDPHMIREAWIHMWGCYKDSIDLPPPLSRDAIDHMTIEQVEMYRYILFP